MSVEIKAIILDCFGVLYISAVEDFLQSNIDDYERHKEELEELGRKADYGLIAQTDYIREIAKMSGLDTEFVKRGVLGGMVQNKELVNYAQSLRGKYKVGLLSNISMHTMDQFFSKADREQLFDEVVISSEVGMIKPHPEIFEFAADKLGVDTSEVVMIDDREENCRGAIESGMKAIVYKNFENTKRELEKLLRL